MYSVLKVAWRAKITLLIIKIYEEHPSTKFRENSSIEEQFQIPADFQEL